MEGNTKAKKNKLKYKCIFLFKIFLNSKIVNKLEVLIQNETNTEICPILL